MCPPGTSGWGLGEDPSDLGALMHRTGCHPVPSVLNSCLKLRQAPSRVSTRAQSPRPGPAGAYTSSAQVVPAGYIHIKHPKRACAHRGHEVGACASSAPSVRVRVERSKCTHAYKCSKCTHVHTKQQECGCAHQADKHTYTSSARSA